jgi:1,4-alpha-glucan branching enzyme
VDANDSDNSVATFLRWARDGRDVVVVACNFTPVPRHGYRVGVPRAGHWREVLNTDAAVYGGGEHGNLGGVATTPVPCHGREQSLDLYLPPLSVVVLRHEGEG